MLQHWPIRHQMYAIFGAWFLAGLMILIAGLILFASVHIQHEREPVERLGAQIAEAATQAVRREPTAKPAIETFLAELNRVSGPIAFHAAGAPAPTETRLPAVPAVPSWFTRLVDPQREQPVLLALPQLGGRLALKPDMAADIFEKWVAFIAALIVPICIALVTLLAARSVVNALMAPLLTVKDGISMLRAGAYGKMLRVAGPREVVRTADELNSLSQTLAELRSTNLALHRKILTVQEQERSEIAQDLHDELGPLLFALRANITALDTEKLDMKKVRAASAQLTEIAEAIQRTNRRILDRLRLTNIAELGFVRSVSALAEGPAAKAGNLTARVEIDERLDALDDLSASTIYRVIQEALTNAVRHAGATALSVKVALVRSPRGEAVHLHISDNGGGYPAHAPRGRGLTGMEERVTALGGSFSIQGSPAGTLIACVVPLDQGGADPRPARSAAQA